MKVFIFNCIDEVSNSYHSGGGLVIIAEDIEHAKNVIGKDKYINPTEDDWKDVEVFELKKKTEPKYWVMPDAGCC